MPDIVRIFRGVTEYNKDNVKVLSWTTDRRVARKFALRFSDEGTLYEGTVSKEHILAYFTRRDESEAIVDPAFIEIKEAKPVKERKK